MYRAIHRSLPRLARRSERIKQIPNPNSNFQIPNPYQSLVSITPHFAPFAINFASFAINFAPSALPLPHPPSIRSSSFFFMILPLSPFFPLSRVQLFVKVLGTA